MGWSQGQVSLFRALLYCYPAEFRHEYGAEMEQLFADRMESEPRFRLWLETLADIAFSAPKEHWHILASDVRYGARVLAAAPGFTGVSLLVIALGISATVAIFSLVNAVLLRSLPFGQPGKLVYLWSPNPNFKGVPAELGPNVPDFYDWQRLSHSFSATTMLRHTAVNIVREESAIPVGAAYVTGSFFRTLEAWPAVGRSFGESEKRSGDQHAAVISDALWRSQFGSDPHILGKQIRLNREQYTVIGIMPKDFGYPSNGDIPNVHSQFKQTDIWLPRVLTASQATDRANFESTDAAIGRLREGVSAAGAEAELQSIQARLNPLYPEMWRGWTALVRPLVQTIIGPVQKMLWLLLGAVGLVLLISISNVANLLLARATGRAHELGIRSALGAERIRLIRQLLTESLLLSSVGGALGVALAYAAVHVLASLNPGDIPRFDAATVDARVLFVALVLSVGTGFVSGLVPAISASRSSVNDLLRMGGSRVGGTSNHRRFALIVLEVALSVILLAGSGLLIRSYLQLAAVDPGFSPSTLTFRLNLDERYSQPAQQAALYKSFLEKLQLLPGVRYAGASNSTPLSYHESVTFAVIRGFGKSKAMVEGRSVTPGYRKALGTPLLRGRDFDEHDINSKSPVMMVNQSFVDTYFRNREPLGGQVTTGDWIGDLSKASWSTVIGIVGNIRHTKLEEASQPQIFQPADSGDNFAMQCDVPVGQVIRQARTALHSLDPALTLEDIHTMSERISEGNARRRFQTSLLTSFAAIAVALALTGLYGLMSYAVKQRRAEIGIRLAIGSSRGRVLALILSQGLRLTAYGLLLGLAGAFALTRLVNGWLYGVGAMDPATFIAVPLFVLVVACCACMIPAWSATRIDPVEALRQE
jgi:predicted permease